MANHPNRSTNKVREVQLKLAPAFETIRELGGRCMEQVIDRENGILCERWVLPNCVNLIVYGTPLWCDVFSPVALSNEWEATLDAIRGAAGIDPRPSAAS